MYRLAHCHINMLKSIVFDILESYGQQVPMKDEERKEIMSIDDYLNQYLYEYIFYCLLTIQQLNLIYKLVS